MEGNVAFKTMTLESVTYEADTTVTFTVPTTATLRSVIFMEGDCRSCRLHRHVDGNAQ